MQTNTPLNRNKTINILGTRGYPAAHGGFETFAARLAPYLRDRGWSVNIYCQIDPTKESLFQTTKMTSMESTEYTYTASERARLGALPSMPDAPLTPSSDQAWISF